MHDRVSSGTNAAEHPLLRRRYRWAAGWVLISAGAHFAVHWAFQLRVPRFSAAFRDVAEQMQTLQVLPSWGVSLWTLFGMFSLLYALLLGMFGVTQWMLARECEAMALRRHAWRNLVLCAGVSTVLLFVYPVPVFVFTFVVAGALYARAAVSPHVPVGVTWPS